MCNIYRGIQNTILLFVTFIVEYKIQSWNSKYNLCVTFIVEYKIQPIMCNIYRRIQNTTYYV